MRERTCYQCGHRLAEESRCQVEEIPEYLDRVGRHYGRCWNGNFPKSSDLPDVTEDEKEEARKRGRNRIAKQLSLEVAKQEAA